jgi:hypothetical protein
VNELAGVAPRIAAPVRTRIGGVLIVARVRLAIGPEVAFVGGIAAIDVEIHHVAAGEGDKKQPRP